MPQNDATYPQNDAILAVQTVTADEFSTLTAADRREIDADEYGICQRRGHESKGYSLGLWMTCKWCGVEFRFTDPELVESNPPSDG